MQRNKRGKHGFTPKTVLNSLKLSALLVYNTFSIILIITLIILLMCFDAISINGAGGFANHATPSETVFPDLFFPYV